MDLKISLLNLNFIVMYIIHKIVVLVKNHLNYLNDNIFECFLRRIIGFYLFFQTNTFFS